VCTLYCVVEMLTLVLVHAILLVCVSIFIAVVDDVDFLVFVIVGLGCVVVCCL
jgi:hypothetical protein